MRRRRRPPRVPLVHSPMTALRRPFAALLFVACFIASCVPHQRNEAPTRPPNIVIIFADDLGYGDLACYGQSRWSTPNLDALAAGGVRLSDFYVAQPVCSASRAALLTGCYPNRVGISGAIGPNSSVGLNPNETTLADLCGVNGYATAIFGKWHLGDAPNLLPLQQGFDEFRGIPYSNDMWPLHPDLIKLPPESEARKRGYPPLPLFEGNTVVNAALTAEDQSNFTRMFTERACDFIARNADQPFFLYLPHPMPHVPIFASSAFTGSSGAGQYGDVIQEIDWSVGRIVEELDRFNLLNNTIVIFTSDNGPWLSYGDHAGTTNGLREGKGTSWDGGVRVPFIASWPGTFPAGRTLTTPAMTIDLLPTIASAIGATAPPVDGVSILPMLTSNSAAPARTLAFYYNSNDLQALRSGKWKLILPHSYRTLNGPAGSGGTPGNYTMVSTNLQLFDLEADPNETTNIAGDYPDILASLLQDAERFRNDLGDSLTNRPGPGRRKPGRAEPMNN